MTIIGWPVTATAPVIDLAQQELEAYRRSGRLGILRLRPERLWKLAAIREGAPPEIGHVGAADEGR